MWRLKRRERQAEAEHRIAARTGFTLWLHSLRCRGDGIPCSTDWHEEAIHKETDNEGNRRSHVGAPSDHADRYASSSFSLLVRALGPKHTGAH
jgi:hypothetical protein